MLFPNHSSGKGTVPSHHLAMHSQGHLIIREPRLARVMRAGKANKGKNYANEIFGFWLVVIDLDTGYVQSILAGRH
jgi:hypothetical protein